MIHSIKNYVRKEEQYSLKSQTFSLITEKLFSNIALVHLRKNLVNYLMDVIDPSNKRDMNIFLELIENPEVPSNNSNKYDLSFIDYVNSKIYLENFCKNFRANIRIGNIYIN
jgi:hypothetical protein